MSALSWLTKNKISVILGITSVCFAIATIVLAVELSKALDDETNNEEDNSTTTTTTTTTAPPLDPWQEDPRIPVEVNPENYTILLRPDLVAGTFEGEVSVQFNLEKKRTWIPIHIKNMTVTDSELIFEGDSTNVLIEDTKLVPENEFYVIFASSELPTGMYTLKMKFAGSLTNKITGFYRSVYTEDEKIRSIASSKFEPTDARAAFPCFDEPALKARFTISLVRPSDGYLALSNMNIESEIVDTLTKTTVVKFLTSELMSTYLVCFIVNDFEYREAPVPNSDTYLPIRVYTTPQQKENGDFALTTAQNVVKWYVDYFGIPFPLPKLDLIGIPDFVSGAMENWGLITFRETALLYDATVNSASNQKRVATVVSHEIAHQWFGDLVTMTWWDDLWLNEGFARFMETKALNGTQDAMDWKLLDQFLLDVVQPVMTVDSALNSHPIVQTVSHPNDINQLFDSISYDKGAAVLRMLEDFLGATTFQNGLREYLNAHKFANAATADLWSSLGKMDSSLNVSEIMATWTEQMGFPIVNVKRSGNSYELTQQRFLPDNNATFDVDESPYKYKWDIPIRYVSANRTQSGLIWLTRDNPKIIINGSTADSLIKFNAAQVGYYRVNYDLSSWESITSEFALFSIPDRSHLFDDAFNLARSGYLPYSVPLDMSKKLLNETEYLPWSTALSGLGTIRRLLADTTTFPEYRKFQKDLLTDLYGSNTNQFSWDVLPEDGQLRRLHRVVYLDEACNVGVDECVTKVGELFQNWLSNGTYIIPPDLKSLVYIHGMKAVGGVTEWDQMWDLYKTETNAQQKVNFLIALAYTNEPWLIKRYLDLAWSEENVRSQDYTAVLGYISSTPVGSVVLWDYYRSQWPKLVERFSLADRKLGSLILSITSTFTTQLKLNELNEFYKLYPDAGAGSAARKNAAENVQNRIEWVRRSEKDISDWLLL